jgi:hypothetical protein
MLLMEQFDRALKLVGQESVDCELSVTGEFDVTESLSRDSRRKPDRTRLLLVDCPLLLLEASALDRAAGVLIRLHVLVSADGERTQVVFIEASALFDRRVPVGAAGPLEELKARISTALEAAVTRVEIQHPYSGGVS